MNEHNHIYDADGIYCIICANETLRSQVSSLTAEVAVLVGALENVESECDFCRPVARAALARLHAGRGAKTNEGESN